MQSDPDPLRILDLAGPNAAMSALAAGMLAGVLLAVPVGPMALLCMRRTLEQGWGSGLASGVGIALGDSTYAAIAAFGLAAVSSVLSGGTRWIEVVGGLALILLGLRSALATQPSRVPSERRGASIAGDAASTYLLTLANPPTIVTFAALAAALGIGSGGGGSAVALVIGVFAGSFGWWLAVTAVLASQRRRMTSRIAGRLARASGVAMAALGLAALFAAVVH